MRVDFTKALNFSSKRVFVAGGSSGIGNAIACGFRDHGAEVIVTGTHPQEYYKADRYSDLAQMQYLQLDATKDEQVRALAAEVSDLDVLVNSIGIIKGNDEEYAVEGFRQTIEASLIGPTNIYFTLLEKLKPRKGCIIGITAISAWWAVPGSPGYNASRAAIPTLMKALGARWASFGIRANAIAPGLVEDTKLSEQYRTNEALYSKSLTGIPLGRWTQRTEVAGVALFLASSIAANMTGQTIIIDGGVSTFPL